MTILLIIAASAAASFGSWKIYSPNRNKHRTDPYDAGCRQHGICYTVCSYALPSFFALVQHVSKAAIQHGAPSKKQESRSRLGFLFEKECASYTKFRIYWSIKWLTFFFFFVPVILSLPFLLSRFLIINMNVSYLVPVCNRCPVVLCNIQKTKHPSISVALVAFGDRLWLPKGSYY